MTKSKIALSKINALLNHAVALRVGGRTPVHDKIRSDQQTDKTGSIMSPKRRTSRVCGIRIAAGQQDIASRSRVKQDFAHFSKIFAEGRALCAFQSRSPIRHSPSLVPKLRLGIEPAGGGARWTEARRVSDRESANQRTVPAKLRFAALAETKISSASACLFARKKSARICVNLRMNPFRPNDRLLTRPPNLG